MHEFWIAIINSVPAAAAAALIATAVLRLGLRANAATRHATWWALLFLICVLPFAFHERAVKASYTPARYVAPEAGAAPVALMRTAVEPRLYTAPSNWSAAAPLTCMWGLFAGWRLLRIGRAALALRRLKREAVPFETPQIRSILLRWSTRRKVRVAVSNSVSSPLAAGFFRPMIVLPVAIAERLSETELRHVILHELAHIERRDDWTQLLARLAGAILFPHPAALWTLRQIDADREMACDDWVVAATGAPQPYASSLARLVELRLSRRAPILATGAVFSKSQVTRRIDAILEAGRTFRATKSRRSFAAACALLVGVIAAGAASPRMIVLARNRPAVRVAFVESDANPSGFLASLKASGYADLSVDEIIELKNNGVNGGFLLGLKRSGFERLPVRVILDLQRNGVRPEYAAAAQSAGIRDFKLAAVARLKNDGVNLELVKEIHALGFGPYDAEEVVAIRHHGIPASFFADLKEAGFRQAPLKEIIHAHAAGLRPQHLRDARSYGPNLGLDKIIKLKNAGVL